MPTVFVSYSPADRQQVEAIRSVLRQIGIEGTQDSQQWDEEGRSQFFDEAWEKVVDALMAPCAAVILVLTPKWLQSPRNYAEFMQARALGKAVIGIVCEPLEENFNDADTIIEFLVKDGTGAVRLQQQLEAALSGKLHQPRFTAEDDSKAAAADPRPTRVRRQARSATDLQPRAIRVFVSSTFRDMQPEREELCKRAFPRLRKLCESRGIVWHEVDLRWGVTDEQKAEGQVLPICLEEVRRCRPYFIGLLGERYGWVLDQIDGSIVEQEPWLSGYRGRSVTELEIVCGVLTNPAMAEHAFFYFRDPAFSRTVEAEAGFEPELIETREKLAGLKERIRLSGLPVRESYHSAQELADWVVADFTGRIDEIFPDVGPPDPLDREALLHQAFERSRSGVYIARTDYFERLDAHVHGTGPPLVLVGESGLGKSALLSNWIRHFCAAHPETYVFAHYLGASRNSTDWAALVRRLIGELNREYGLSISLPDQALALRRSFADALRRVGAIEPVVIVIDGLNQLEDRDRAPDLAWLPRDLPPRVRLVLSTLPGRTFDEIERREWPKFELAPLDTAERQRLIVEYLAQYRKALDQRLIRRIAEEPVSASPLFLTALLEELRLWREHETLANRIGHYLKAETSGQLFDKILDRYEQDYDRDRSGLVCETMALIWGSHSGLAESELLDLLGADGQPLPSAFWSPLYLAADHSLVSRGGLLDFFHDYLRQAVCQRYLPDADRQRRIHARLADYFAARELSPRKVGELPWQLAQARGWERLRDLLGDLPFFQAAWDAGPEAVRGYWQQVKDAIPEAPLQAYRTVLGSPNVYFNYLWNVAAALHYLGYCKESFALQFIVAQEYFKSRDLKKIMLLIRVLSNQVANLIDFGQFALALQYCDWGLTAARESGDPTGTALLTMTRGNVRAKLERWDDAMADYQQAEQLFRFVGDRASVATLLSNQAMVWGHRGKPDVAVRMLREQIVVLREIGTIDELTNCLGYLGTALKQVGKFEDALKALQEQERLAREIGDPDEVQRSLGNQGSVHFLEQHWEQALGIFQRREQVCRQSQNDHGLVEALESQAMIRGTSE